MAKKILLIEPNYKNKYPPIGLMKLSTYHKMQNDKVEFFKGELKDLINELKYKKCVKSLHKVDKRINWENKKDIIDGYLQTRQKKYLNFLIEKCSINKANKIETILKFQSKNIPRNNWDRIYVTTLFTFYWDITIKTIETVKKFADNNKIFIGGVMASLLKDEIYKETGILPFSGLLDKPGMLDQGNKLIVDELPLDYSILDEINYKYPAQNAYFTYMTKGCTRKCAFCSVPKLEPAYKEKIDSLDKFEAVNNRFGEKRNLLLMDNNVLASPKFPEIIQEIKSMGFRQGAIFNEPNQLEIVIKNLKDGFNDKGFVRKAQELISGLTSRLDDVTLLEYDKILNKYNLNDNSKIKKEDLLKASKQLTNIYELNRPKTNLLRYVDFNQGTDARYVTEENMKLMSEIPIRPLRIAFDHIGIKKVYINAVELACKYGIKNLSNYILYNFHDKPEEFYERLRINVELGKKLNIQIFSFPMKYIPLFGEEAKHRRFIGTHWNKKFIRAIQSILNATKGIVAPGYEFFNMAFGKSPDDFFELLWMPENYIINRIYFQKKGLTDQWRNDFDDLDDFEKIQAKEFIKENNFSEIQNLPFSPRILRLLSHYFYLKEEKIVAYAEVRKLRNKYNRLIKKDLFINLTLTHDFDSQKRNKIFA
ncbi:MAG TPA: hypothetical protein VK787_01185 [Puia sp.]|jgi:hypothetical protein|nr:hypothetical protein [Puia sp.]